MTCRPKMGWRSGVLVVTIALACTTLAQAQQTTPYVASLKEMMDQAGRVADIEANKATFVGELLGRFAEEAAARGHDAFLRKGTRKLMARSGEDLLRLSQQATDYDTLHKLVFEGYTINTFGQLTQELVFFPITACRLYDSRVATTGGLIGPMAPGTTRNISVNDSTTGQGGANPDCNTVVPDLDNDPPALALTLTAAGPTGPGNLRTFDSSGAVPNAAMLTYTTGTTISAGVITSSCTSCGTELAVRNQGAGNTDVVIDVVGYFHAPFVQAVSCTRVTTAFSTAPSTFVSCSAACPAGYTATGAGLLDNGSSPGVEIRTMGLSNATTASFLGWNASGSTWGGNCQVTCCRVPGR